MLAQLRQHHLIAAIRSVGDHLTIKVFQKPPIKPPRKTINLLLFLVTIGSVFFAGYYLWTNGLFGIASLQQQFTTIIDPGANPYLKSGLFAGGLLSIVGLHEFGHKAVAQHHRMDATLPYFIPGFPPIGTFGAVISLKSPPSNRDQLFDLGFSGPIVGLVVTIVVAVLSVFLGTVPTATQLSQLNQWSNACGAQFGTTGCISNYDFSSWPQQPLLLIMSTGLAGLARPNAFFDGQLFFAAQVGSLLTFLNIIPAWQLDGGHIARAVLGPRGHRISSIIGLTILLGAGIVLFFSYFFFALLMLIFMRLSRRGFAGVEPLDDVSPVSNSRKALYLSAIVLLVLTFALLPF